MQISHIDPQQPVHLVQITDTHLGPEPGDALLGLDTDFSLDHVLELVGHEQAQPDLLLATGDISNCGAAASYRRFYQLSHGLARHSLWLPGNHDAPATMQQTMAGSEVMDRFATAGNWEIIMLDSSIPGEPGGRLGATELAGLRQRLQQTDACHVLVCLHHHPITIGCEWLDQQRVSNADDFFDVLDDFDLVRGVLWGHVHQAIDLMRNGVKLMATPSSCIQFEPNNTGFKLGRQDPGYRWLKLWPDGRIESAVSRVSGVSFDIDYDQAGGY